MTDLKITQTQKAEDYTIETTFEAKDIDFLDKGLLKRLFGKEKEPDKTVKITDLSTRQSRIEGTVVAIYDNAGIPSFMYRFTKTTDKELFGGKEKTHPAFVIGGEEYDEIYISVFENCEINGKPYSLPYQKPWTEITNDNAAKACFSKGEGWHLLTAAEWGLLADTSLMLETFPHGNTAGSISAPGSYHANVNEKGKLYDEYKTLTGSGPATWTHNHTPEGVHDLCGNICEMIRGLRIKNGRLQRAKDNDAALNIDLTEEGDGWEDILDDNGKSIRVSVDRNITFTTDRDIEQEYAGNCWEDITIDCESEQLKELALFPGEPKAYCFIDSREGEYFPFRGGDWCNGADAGIFSMILSGPRSFVSAAFGFRSAYFKKN